MPLTAMRAVYEGPATVTHLRTRPIPSSVRYLSVDEENQPRLLVRVPSSSFLP